MKKPFRSSQRVFGKDGGVIQDDQQSQNKFLNIHFWSDLLKFFLKCPNIHAYFFFGNFNLIKRDQVDTISNNLRIFQSNLKLCTYSERRRLAPRLALNFSCYRLQKLRKNPNMLKWSRNAFVGPSRKPVARDVAKTNAC